MFKSISIFKIRNAAGIPSAADILQRADQRKFVPCAPSEMESRGWVPMRQDPNALLVEDVAGHLLMRLKIEKKSVPASAVKKELDARVKKAEDEIGRKLGSKFKKELKDEIVREFLPRVFSRESTITLAIDKKNGFVFVSSTSDSACDEVITRLIEVAGEGVALNNVSTKESPPAVMSAWLLDQESPAGFTMDGECELKKFDEMRSAVKYSRHNLYIDEIVGHIKEGKTPVSLSMTFDGRVSFVLTDRCRVCKIKLLDVVLDEAGKNDHADAFAADAAIELGELGKLVPAVLDVLGGEADPAAVREASVEEQAAAETAAATGSESPWHDAAVAA